MTDDDTLEESSHRKYEFACDSLGLRAGMELLEIGCGWGGMTRFCASRGVRVTGHHAVARPARGARRS